MKIGIISDTHDHIENIQKAVRIFKEQECRFVLHLGDFVNPMSIRLFKGVKLIAVFGNNDGDKFRLIDAFAQIKGEIRGDFYEFEQDELKIAMYHGTDLSIKDALIECGRYDILLYGHTHQLEKKMVGSTLALNPGTAHGFGKQATIAVLDTNTKQVEIINLL